MSSVREQIIRNERSSTRKHEEDQRSKVTAFARDIVSYGQRYRPVLITMAPKRTTKPETKPAEIIKTKVVNDNVNFRRNEIARTAAQQRQMYKSTAEKGTKVSIRRGRVKGNK
jgi:hypothetical protein